MRHSRLYGIMAGMLSGMLVLSVSSCVKDDFDRYQNGSDALSFKVEVSGGWSEGTASSSTTSIRRMSQSTDAEPLYLVTKVSDSAPVSAESGVVTRGTPIEKASTLETGGFGLSAICYTGDWPAEDKDNNWTTNFAHNLNVTKQDGHWKASEKLEWPGSGKIRFFAYYPYSKNLGDYIAHSDAGTGLPVLTYTVPQDVKKQQDLLCAVADHSGKSEGNGTVNLEFKHALTAVKIKCGTGMLAGKISKVEISGVYGKGKQVIGSDEWEALGTHDATYTISDEIPLSPSTNENVADKIHAPQDTPIAGTDDDGLTFMLLPQTLPDGATMTIEFTDDATGTERTLTASLAGQKWEAGKTVTYSVSPSSIEIKAKVEFSKTGVTAENLTGDIMPYSGVWYDATYTAKVEITQADVETKTIDIPEDKVKFQYQLDGSDSWEDCTPEASGLLTIAPQPAYKEMKEKFTKTGELCSMDNPFDLGIEKGETANCYLVDQAGYYSLPLRYGNGNLNLPAEADNPDGFKYFPNHKDEKIISPNISGAEDAVLCWQDAPDLIDPESVNVVDDELVFRIRERTLTQGNALLAVRNADKEIIWSWHIWVTPYKDDFYNQGNFYHSTTTLKPEGYDFAQYNLGWCDPHEHNPSREFSLRAVVDMSAYGGRKETEITIGTFTQDVFKGSDGGDNTYYQWGRKDPMLGGIYNDDTPKYTYTKKPGYDNKLDTDEFTMENKQVFNQYNQDGCNYSFCKNPGDKIDSEDEASKGVSIGYAIQHPYMFVTNSSCSDKSGEVTDFNYRNHWHKPYKHYHAPYLHSNSHILFNAWDAGATAAAKNDTDKLTARDIKKSVYDPCPPLFKVPPFDAFQGIVSNSSHGSLSGNAWKLEYDGKSITFPLTGVRDYALRSNEWSTVKPVKADPEFSYIEFYKISMPAFKSLTFISSATIIEAQANGTSDQYNAYQVNIFRYQNGKIGTVKSSNSYGLSVRPIYSK